MRIAGSEYLKLFSNKIFLICIIAFFCADSLFFVMLQSSDYENSAISSDVGAYEQLIRECNDAEDKMRSLKARTRRYRLHKFFCTTEMQMNTRKNIQSCMTMRQAWT